MNSRVEAVAAVLAVTFATWWAFPMYEVHLFAEAVLPSFGLGWAFVIAFGAWVLGMLRVSDWRRRHAS